MNNQWTLQKKLAWDLALGLLKWDLVWSLALELNNRNYYALGISTMY